MCRPGVKGKQNCCGHGHGRGYGHGGFRRHFISKSEEIEMLKDYKEQLRKELSGVEERIKDLKE